MTAGFAALLSGGRLADAIIGLTVLEGVALTAYRRRAGGGVPARALFFNLLAGAFLVLALRCALTGAPMAWLAACLLLALLAHVADLGQRWEHPHLARETKSRS